MNAPLQQQVSSPERVLDDRRWQLREAMRETLAIARWHIDMADQYLDAGQDWGENLHAGNMVRCVKAYLATHNELAALNEGGGSHE